MDAEDWLESIEKKLQVVQCNNSLVLQPIGGMLIWKPMRSPRASTGQNSGLLSVHLMFPKE
jgi:hypothetical protein